MRNLKCADVTFSEFERRYKKLVQKIESMELSSEEFANVFPEGLRGYPNSDDHPCAPRSISVQSGLISDKNHYPGHFKSFLIELFAHKLKTDREEGGLTVLMMFSADDIIAFYKNRKQSPNEPDEMLSAGFSSDQESEYRHEGFPFNND